MIDLNFLKTQGFSHFNFDYIKEENFDIYDFLDPNDYPDWGEESFIDERAQVKLQEIFLLIGERFLKQSLISYELKGMSMWDGVDKTSADWHDDYQTHSNFKILLYLDEGTISNENYIEIKSIKNLSRIYPKVGDLVFLYLKRDSFLHRASHGSGKRRVISYELFTETLPWN